MEIFLPSALAVIYDLTRDQLVWAAVSETQNPETLQDFVKARIAPYKYPRAVEFVAELPKTQTGKLQRFRLRDEPGGGDA